MNIKDIVYAIKEIIKDIKKQRPVISVWRFPREYGADATEEILSLQGMEESKEYSVRDKQNWWFETYSVIKKIQVGDYILALLYAVFTDIETDGTPITHSKYIIGVEYTKLQESLDKKAIEVFNGVVEQIKKIVEDRGARDGQ